MLSNTEMANKICSRYFYEIIVVAAASNWCHQHAFAVMRFATLFHNLFTTWMGSLVLLHFAFCIAFFDVKAQQNALFLHATLLIVARITLY